MRKNNYVKTYSEKGSDVKLTVHKTSEYGIKLKDIWTSKRYGIPLKEIIIFHGCPIKQMQTFH